MLEAAMEMKYQQRSQKALKSDQAIENTIDLIQKNYPDLYRSMLDSGRTIGRLTVFGKMSAASVLEEKMILIQNLVDTYNENGLIVKPAGYLPLYANIINYISRSQLYSLTLAVIFIFVLVWIYTKDFILAIVAMVTNMFPLLILFGICGWFKIDIDLATASIAAISLSFCIDDSLHVAYYFKQARKKEYSKAESLSYTFRTVGPALIISSGILFFGYALLTFSSLKTVYLFGGLTAAMILSALYAQYVIFPKMVLWLKK
jgi:predicted RND superfamily exporter protein